MHRHILLFTFFFRALFADPIPYEIHFEGDIDPATLTVLQTASQMFKLQDRPPASVMALRTRAEADVAKITKGLQSLAYYSPDVHLQINTNYLPATVIYHIHKGPIYPIASFEILPGSDKCVYNFKEITSKDVGVCIGEPAYPKSILDAENELLTLLAEDGYPLAVVQKKEVVADQHYCSIGITFYVDPGPLIYFGTTEIQGLCKVKETFVRNKIYWDFGDIFDPQKIARTQCALEATGLFSGVSINYPEGLEDEHILPMQIQLTEAKHRRMGVGASITTQLGPGVGFEWENRNFSGSGEKVALRSYVWRKQQSVNLLYCKPDFLCSAQTFNWVYEVLQVQTKGFDETSLSLSGLVDRRLDSNSSFCYGGKVKQLYTKKTENNGASTLFKTPLHLRWSEVDQICDPTVGIALNFKVIPTLEITGDHSAYIINSLTTCIYHYLNYDQTFIAAAKVNIGTILGANPDTIPIPEKLFAGSPCTLRGYNYLTVSPLDAQGNPIGGLSLLIFSFELRKRATEEFGFVLFHDMGNVYRNPFPNFWEKYLQCTGVGLLYHTPAGPIRFDIAVPWNRRPGIDAAFQYYFSVGQAF